MAIGRPRSKASTKACEDVGFEQLMKGIDGDGDKGCRKVSRGVVIKGFMSLRLVLAEGEGNGRERDRMRSG